MWSSAKKEKCKKVEFGRRGTHTVGIPNFSMPLEWSILTVIVNTPETPLIRNVKSVSEPNWLSDQANTYSVSHTHIA